jgi:hypothetical protein
MRRVGRREGERLKQRERDHREAGVGLATSAPSYRLKLDRADVHLDSLDRAAQRFLKENCGISVEFDSETGEHFMRARVASQPPPYLSVLAGDVVHNLRSALSHLVHELAQARSAGSLSEAVAQGLDFPICSNPDSFRSQRNDKLRGIAADVQELIKAMQPYEGEDWRPLAFVHDLNRVDKHRKLNLVTAAVTRHRTVVNASKSFTIKKPGPVEDGTELVRWHAPRGNSNKEPEPQTQATFDVVLGEGPHEGGHLVTRLKDASAVIRDRVIPTLEPHL